MEESYYQLCHRRLDGREDAGQAQWEVPERRIPFPYVSRGSIFSGFTTIVLTVPLLFSAPQCLCIDWA